MARTNSARSSRVRVAPLPAALPELRPSGLDLEDCPDQVAGEKAHGHGRGAAFWIIAAAALACLVVLAIVLAVALHRSSSISQAVNATVATTQAAGATVANVNITAFTGVSGARSGADYNQAFRDGTYADAANPTAAEIQAVVDAANGKGGQTNKTGVCSGVTQPARCLSCPACAHGVCCPLPLPHCTR